MYAIRSYYVQQQFPALEVRPIRKVSANEGAVLFKRNNFV